MDDYPYNAVRIAWELERTAVGDDHAKSWLFRACAAGVNGPDGANTNG